MDILRNCHENDDTILIRKRSLYFAGFYKNCLQDLQNSSKIFSKEFFFLSF